MNKKLLVSVFAVMSIGLLLRLLFLYQFSSIPLFDNPGGPDVSEYDSWAKAILSGKLLWLTPQLHAPLYPFCLALLYKLCNLNYYWIRLIQTMIGLGVFLPLFFMLKNHLKSAWAAWSILILAAIYPPLIFYQCALISEALLLPLLAITLYLFYFADMKLAHAAKGLNIRLVLWYILPGLGCGLAIICHPLSALFCGISALIMVISQANYFDDEADINQAGPRQRRWVAAILPAVIMLMTTATIVLPVMAYNATLPGGSFAIQHNSGFNFFIGNNSKATGGCDVRPGRDWEHLQQEGQQAATREHISFDHYYFKKSLDYIAQNPFGWLKLMLKKSLYVWNFREMKSGADLEPLRYYSAFQRWTWWSGGALLSMTLLGLFAVFRQKKLVLRYRYLLALLFSFWIMLTLTVVSGRYRITMFPACAGLAGVGSCYLFRAIRQWRQWHGLIIPLLVLGIATAIVWVPKPHYDQRREWAEANVMLGELYLKQGKLNIAKKCFIRALKASAKMDRAYYGLGVFYMKTGQYQRAAAFYIKSFQLNPYSCDAYVSLGIMSMAMHDLHFAGQYFAEAEKKWPNVPFLLYNYSIYLIKRGKIERAELKLKRCLKKDPANIKVLQALGAIELMHKQPNQAAQYFQTLLKILPSDHTALLSMAGISLKTRHYRQAKYYITQLLKAHPNSRQGVELQKVIDKYLTKAMISKKTAL